MDVAITGSTGLIGTAVRRRLEADGHRVIPVVRSGSPDTISWDPAAGTIDASAFEGLDAVVHFAARSIGTSLRWTQAHKQAVYDSRINGTRLLAGALAGLQRPPAVLVSASAIGYYGNRGDEVLVETSGPGTGFLADLVVDWEAATSPAEGAGVRVVHLRSGLVLSGDGGLLPTMMLPFRFGLGGKLGAGDQWMSWVSIDDEASAVVHLLHGDTMGPVNVASPNAVTNADFTKVLARVLRRPAFFRVPAAALKLVLGMEAANETVLTSQRALPARLRDSGYAFKHPELEGALCAVLGRS